jgi:CubicO group peptidase (beta-lactamase class C family)
VEKHLPDYPNREWASNTTRHQLLTHTSGLGDYFTPAFFAMWKHLLRQIKDCLFVNDPPLFEPGAHLEYSNAGYMLLGAIIEAASGESYFEDVRRYITAPASMPDTDLFEGDDIVGRRHRGRRAIGYTNYRGPADVPIRWNWQATISCTQSKELPRAVDTRLSKTCPSYCMLSTQGSGFPPRSVGLMTGSSVPVAVGRSTPVRLRLD